VAGYTKWLLDTRQQSLFLARGLGPVTLGAGVSSFAAGTFEYRLEVPTDDPLGTFEPVELTAYLNASRSLGPVGTPLGSLGASLRYFYSKIMSYEASGFGFDLGARYRPLGGLVLGASLVDFGQTLSFVRGRTWLPTRVRLGVSYSACFAGWRLTLAADGSYFMYSSEYGGQAGLEVEPVRLLQARAGYDTRAGGVSFGLGLRPGRFLVDYSFAPLRYDLGAAHRISIGLGL
jgi:hypothetical protein